jgi:hypothetical protein
MQHYLQGYAMGIVTAGLTGLSVQLTVGNGKVPKSSETPFQPT